MYVWSLCNVYALNNHFVYLAITGTRPFFYEKVKLVWFIYVQPQKSETQICSNKHETGLVFLGSTGTIQMTKYPALGHNAVPLVRF